jgi:hypothetical protein
MYRYSLTSSLVKKISIIVAAAALGVVCAAAPSQAAVSQVFSRGALAGDDYIDWSSVGVSNTVVSNPFNTLTNNGLGVSGSMPAGQFERRDQGSTWSGNFASGDRVLWTQLNTGPLVLEFLNPVIGAGTQIQADYFGSFTGSIEAFDSANSSLGLFSLPGVSDGSADNSAIFLGLRSDTANIKKIAFLGDHSQYLDNFAINRVDLVTSRASEVPEPGTLVLLGTGIVGLISRRRRRTVA